ncbi:MAG: DMT family transporter [Bacillota bacterium]
MRRFAYLLPLIAGTCWGCTGIFVRTLDKAGFDNITITFSRVIVMVAIMLVATWVYNKDLYRIRKRDLWLLAVIGVNGFVLMNICYNISITTLSMSLASILLCTAPVFVIIFGRILFGEKITALRVTCMVGALIGCVLLSGVVESGGLKWSVLGLAMGVASSMTNAAYAIALKEATDVRKIHPLTIQLYTAIIGLIILAPFTDHAAIVNFVADAPVSGSLFLLAHALVASLMPNLLFAIAFIYVDSSVASILASGAEPTAAMLVGLMVYSEIPTVFGIIGMIIVIVSMIVLSRTDVKSTE